MNLTKSFWAFGFFLVLVVGLNPGTVAWAHHAGGADVIVGNCDSDGDGFITNHQRCRKKNPGHDVDCDDSDETVTDDCATGTSGDPIEFDTALIKGPFRFETRSGSNVLVFEVDPDSPNEARNDTDVIVIPSDNGPGWTEFFLPCSWALKEPSRDGFLVPRGRAIIFKTLGAISLYFGGMIGVEPDGDSVEFTVQLKGSPNDEAFNNNILGDPFTFVFDRHGLGVKPLRGGKRCGSGSIQLISHPTSELEVL